VQSFAVLGRFLAGLLARWARLSGRRLAFWTVNTDGELRNVSRLADIVISDDVDRAVAWFKSP
jgi:hypothetical protein